MSKGLLDEVLHLFSPHLPDLYKNADRLLKDVDPLPGIQFTEVQVPLTQKPVRPGDVTADAGPDVIYKMQVRSLLDVMRRSCEQYGAAAKRPMVTDGLIIDDVTTGTAYQALLRRIQHKHGDQAVLIPLIFHSGSCTIQYSFSLSWISWISRIVSIISWISRISKIGYPGYPGYPGHIIDNQCTSSTLAYHANVTSSHLPRLQTKRR